MAAEAKTLSLESDLYEARRTIEVLEEKVQGVMGRGDLFKIRAEVNSINPDHPHPHVCASCINRHQWEREREGEGGGRGGAVGADGGPGVRVEALLTHPCC